MCMSKGTYQVRQAVKIKNDDVTSQFTQMTFCKERVESAKIILGGVDTDVVSQDDKLSAYSMKVGRTANKT